MARTACSWYAADKRAYRPYLRSRRITLLKGDENPTIEKLAKKKVRRVLRGSKNDTAPGQLIADVIERCLKFHQSK